MTQHSFLAAARHIRGRYGPYSGQSAVRVLSCDGGGIRGIYQSAFLQEARAKCQDKYQTDILDEVNIYAGTSTGAIVAASLASGEKTPGQITDLYAQHGTTIFPPPRKRVGTKCPFDVPINKCIAASQWASRKLRSKTWAKYDTKPLSDLLDQVFGDQLFVDLPKRCIIMSLSLHSHAPRTFDSQESGGEIDTLKVKDVVLASAAAPIYFKPHKAGSDTFVDGGLVCNDPSSHAIDVAIKNGADANNIRVLSVGTCAAHDHTISEGLDKPPWNWVLPTVKLCMTGSAKLASNRCQSLLPAKEQYCRADSPETAGHIELDDAIKAIKVLPALGKEKARTMVTDGSLMRWLN